MRSSKKNIFTVSEVAHDLQSVTEENFPFLSISGELSNAKIHSSGHFYFTLKDEGAQIAGVMWRRSVSALKFRPEDGLKVVVSGKLSFYPPQGKIQFYAEHIEPEGAGALALAFEQLKAKLAAEGLFDADRKRPLPLLPRKVGIITSETGAVIHDLIQNIKRRFPLMDIAILPAKVQGEGAAEDLAEKVIWINNTQADIEVLIVGRGGGSLEDLSAFNDEGLARAIFASRIPIISAVGHESDFTIADFVADVRASTPTAAAELAVPLFDDLVYEIDQNQQKLKRAWARMKDGWQTRLRYCESHIKRPREFLNIVRNRLNTASLHLHLYASKTVQGARERKTLAFAKLNILSPLAILNRGYAIVFKEGNPQPIKDPQALRAGDRLAITLANGEIRAERV